MDDVTYIVSGLGGRDEKTAPAGTTLADLRAQGIISEGVGVRQAGLPVSDTTEIVNGGHYVTTPPAAKHG